MGRGLIYAGGIDETGAPRTDLWSLRVGTERATLIASDTDSPAGGDALDHGSFVSASGSNLSAVWRGFPSLSADGTIDRKSVV